MKSLKDYQKKSVFISPYSVRNDRMTFREMGSMASSWSIKAGKKAAKVGAGAQPCLIRSQVKLCGSWPVTPCTIVHNAISISSTPKFNSTLNSFKYFYCKYLSFSFQRQTDRDLITQNSLITSDRSRLFYLETFKTFIQDVFINCCPLQVLSLSTFHQNSS